MSTVADPLGKPVPTRQLEALTESRRRRIVAALRSRTGSVPDRRLAARVAAAERDEAVRDVPASAVDAVYASLRHVHLPVLADAGLVERSDDGVVATEAVRANPWVARLVEAEAENWDAVLSCLANAERQTVLAALRDRGGVTSLEALARALAGREDDRAPTAVRTALYHRHLPKLAAADLIAYDADAGTVEYLGHPELPPLSALEG